jgi:hypothetical protein
MKREVISTFNKDIFAPYASTNWFRFNGFFSANQLLIWHPGKNAA